MMPDPVKSTPMGKVVGAPYVRRSRKVRAAPEEKAKRNAARDEVGQGEKRNVVDERVYDACDHDTDESAVEGHPPLPRARISIGLAR